MSAAQGMQHNPGMRTIEGELMAALHNAGAVSEENAGDFAKVRPCTHAWLHHLPGSP